MLARHLFFRTAKAIAELEAHGVLHSWQLVQLSDGDWDKLEELLAAYVPKGSRNRTNLAPDAPRDQWGRQVVPLPSDRVYPGHPMYELCKRVSPG